MGHIKKGIVIAAIMLAAVLTFVFWTERQGDEAKFSDFLYSRLKITDEHVKRITLRRYIDDYSFISADDPLEQAEKLLDYFDRGKIRYKAATAKDIWTSDEIIAILAGGTAAETKIYILSDKSFSFVCGVRETEKIFICESGCPMAFDDIIELMEE